MPLSRNAFLVAALAVSVLRFAPPAGAQAPQYVVQDLGTLGGSVSTATGVNNLGQVTGWSYTPAEQYTRAFRFSNGVMVDLGTLAAGDNSFGYGINASGQVTGAAPTFTTINLRAFRTTGAVMSDLGTLGGGTYSTGVGINASGQVAGYSGAAGGAERAFRYSGGAMTNLGTLGGF